MAEVNLDIEADPGVKLLLSQLRRDPPGMPTDNRLVQSLKNTGVPYLAISAIGNALAGSAIRVKIRDEKGTPPGTSTVVKSQSANQQHKDDELRDAPSSHPLCRLFDYINPNDTFEDLMMDATLQYCLTGTAPFWFVPSRLGNPCEMYVLPTALMLAQPVSPQYPEGSWLIQQYFPAGAYGIVPSQTTGAGVRVDGRQIKRFRMRHPLWRWDGYSPLTAGGVQLDVLNAIDESRKSAMDHGFNPDAVITVAGANAESLNRLKADMENRHGGSRNARKVLFSNGQSIDVETLSTNPKEMDYGSGWDQMVKYALALFGVPPGTAGIAEATSYAQLYASLRQFYALRLQPLAKSLGSFLTKHVAADVDPNSVIQIDVPDIDDKEMEKSKWDSAAQNNAVTLNEYRGYMSLPAMPDGERLIGDPSAAQQAAEAAQNGQPQEPQTPEDAVSHSVLGMLGVDPNAAGGGQVPDSGTSTVPGGTVEKAMVGKFEENKHKRNHGKFSSSAGAGANPQSGGLRKPVGTGAKPAQKPMARIMSAEPGQAGTTEGPGNYLAGSKYLPVPGLINHFNKLGSASSDATAWAKGIKFPQQAVTQVREQIAKTGQDASALSKSNQWAVAAAKKHAANVATKIGKDPKLVERGLFHMFMKMAEAVNGGRKAAIGNVAGVGSFYLRKKQQDQPPASSPQQTSGPKPTSSRSGLLDVRRESAKHGHDIGKAGDAIRKDIDSHIRSGGEVSAWMDGKEIPIKEIRNNAMYDHKGQQWGMMPLAMGRAGKKTGIEFKPGQSRPRPQRRDLSALFKSAPELVEIFKGL